MMFRFINARFVLLVLTTVLMTGCSSLGGSSDKTAAPDMLLPLDSAEPAKAERAALTPSPARPESGRLMGLTPTDVESLLGKPSLVRVEMAAQVMQFVNGDCVLDVFMSEPQPGAQFRTQHVEARDRDGKALPEEQCLAVLIPQELW